MAVVEQQREEPQPLETEWMTSVLGPTQLSLGAQVLEDIAFYLRDLLHGSMFSLVIDCDNFGLV